MKVYKPFMSWTRHLTALVSNLDIKFKMCIDYPLNLLKLYQSKKTQKNAAHWKYDERQLMY